MRRLTSLCQVLTTSRDTDQATGRLELFVTRNELDLDLDLSFAHRRPRMSEDRARGCIYTSLDPIF